MADRHAVVEGHEVLTVALPEAREGQRVGDGPKGVIRVRLHLEHRCSLARRALGSARRRRYTSAVLGDDGSPRRPAPRGVANEEGLLALGDAIERRGGRAPQSRRRAKRRRRQLWMRRGVVGVALLLIVVVGAGAYLYYHFGGLIHRATVTHLQPDGPGTNILLVGSTDRCAFKQQNPMWGLCQDGVTGVNSDIVMIAHLQGPNVTLLSIPRDLFVPNARCSSTTPTCPAGAQGQANKIDAALFNGPGQLAAAIEEDFGIPINHYIELNFQTFSSVVDAVGGIYMYFPIRVFDAESSLNIERPGCYYLNGIHALEVVRARHLQVGFSPGDKLPAGAWIGGSDPRSWWQEPESDLARIRRTHEFLRIVAAKINADGFGNPIHDLSLANAIFPDLTVDTGWSESSMLSLALAYKGTDISKVPEYTFPIAEYFGDPSDAYDYIFQGGNYGEIEFPVEPGGWLAIDKLFGAKVDQSPWDDKALPAAGTFPMSVVDGSGIADQQVSIGDALRAQGDDVTATGSVAPSASTNETVVWYGGPQPPAFGEWNDPALEDAQRVETQLEGPVILGYDPSMVTKGDLVTVQTGNDLTIAPASLSVPTTTTTSTSTSTSSTLHVTSTTSVTPTTVIDPSGIKSDPNLSAPSSLAQPLAAWDPRACTDAQLLHAKVDTSGDG